ncbi:MAG TPA: 3-phosphoshikimate 1-carboxyvinyltransferase [Acidimicrobiales bacterium]|nr:3-phosphoshikimate 1-carboxyvinyltransferase [Acidimicrobiales bacterium]
MTTRSDQREWWPAPLAGRPVSAHVTLPGSKSMTNRALVLAALAQSPSVLSHALFARDTELMMHGLQAMGVVVGVNDRRDETLVIPAALSGPAQIDVGNAGTVMRFLLPVAALADGDVAFDGDARSHERPLGPVIDALGALGVDVDHGSRRSLPLVVHGRGFVGSAGPDARVVEIDASASSQFVSALLLAAPRFAQPLLIRHVGAPVPSQPHIDMTVEMLRDRGVAVDTTEANEWRVEPTVFEGFELTVEPDLSNAAAFLAAAMVTAGTVTVDGWPARTTQAGDRLRELFSAMGAKYELTADGLTLHGPRAIAPIDVDLHDTGELAPVLAAVCARASGPSTLRGIAHLRAHETDRLSALAHELGALGALVTELPDGLHIDPAPLHGAPFATYDDHRLATAGAVLGLVVPGVTVEDIATTAKTLPDFVTRWRSMLDERRR